jgi:hypothetical protein
MRAWTFLIAALVVAAFPARPPQAANAAQIQQIWMITDQCRKESFVKFPDQTSEGQQQRNKYVKACKIKRLGSASSIGQD